MQKPPFSVGEGEGVKSLKTGKRVKHFRAGVGYGVGGGRSVPHYMPYSSEGTFHVLAEVN